MDFLAAAVRIAERSNLRVITKRNSEGRVITYRVYRAMPTHLVFLGSRSDPSALLSLVENLARGAVFPA
jgi:hypothetical protein